MRAADAASVWLGVAAVLAERGCWCTAAGVQLLAYSCWRVAMKG